MHIKNRNKFRFTRFIIFNAIAIFKFLARFKTPKKRLLIIKFDAIGDYILFRNYLEILRNDVKFKGYEIDLIGSVKWKDLALTYDAAFVDNFHFIDSDNIAEEPLTLLSLGWRLFQRKYEVAIQSTYSRTFVGNVVSALATARETIGYNSLKELQPKYKKRTDKYYSKLIKLPADIFHEYEINHNFFEQLIGRTLPKKRPSFPIKKDIETGIIIFPGSGFGKRNWEKEKFLEIIKRLLKSTNEMIILAGGPGEKAVSDYLMTHFTSSENVIDKTCQLSLVEFVKLIANAKLLISNETSAVHIAAACDTKSICILGGGHFNRFTPYPQALSSKITCVYHEMECYNCDWLCKYVNDEKEPFKCISNVDVEKTWNIVANILHCNPGDCKTQHN